MGSPSFVSERSKLLTSYQTFYAQGTSRGRNFSFWNIFMMAQLIVHCSAKTFLPLLEHQKMVKFAWFSLGNIKKSPGEGKTLSLQAPSGGFATTANWWHFAPINFVPVHKYLYPWRKHLIYHRKHTYIKRGTHIVLKTKTTQIKCHLKTLIIYTMSLVSYHF